MVIFKWFSHMKFQFKKNYLSFSIRKAIIWVGISACVLCCAVFFFCDSLLSIEYIYSFIGGAQKPTCASWIYKIEHRVCGRMNEYFMHYVNVCVLPSIWWANNIIYSVICPMHLWFFCCCCCRYRLCEQNLMCMQKRKKELKWIDIRGSFVFVILY